MRAFRLQTAFRAAFRPKLLSATSRTTKFANYSTSSDAHYFALRLAEIEAFEKRTGKTIYHHHWPVSTTIEELRSKYDNELVAGEKRESELVYIAGRITSKRSASKKLHFYSLSSGNGALVQIMSNKQHYRSSESDDSEFDAINELLKRGDLIGVYGYVAKTKTGELSVVPKQIQMLSPCLHPLPSHFGLEDIDTRYRHRYLDMLVNSNVKSVFETRSRVIRYIRSFLEQRQFVEVETPMLCLNTGGANAKPFHTYLNAANLPLKLRIAPELFLKQLVIGGMERVFEIGKQFRNEGMDATHNPEFTTCEFYMAYADYNTLIGLTEEMISGMVKEITGGYVVPMAVNGQVVDIDFTPPFRRISYLEFIEEQIREKLPLPDDPECVEKLKQICERCGLSTQKTVPTYAKLIDLLASEYAESRCVQPTFLIEHPIAISPLAKKHRAKPGVTERFELFVGTRELCNAYTELNDPREQRDRFASQAKERAAGDVEAQETDDVFCRALEYGLPPTAGWGCGVDRLVMILTRSAHIRETILFPTMKPIPQTTTATKETEQSGAEAQQQQLQRGDE